ncbi:MAG: hypothetical protein B0D92_08300 [Spirochaeta sp. LUC14_002_19_P3]|nr:MAG: hypothetical protein B0D92_08300 [Spirochaeta sp. LUC14_002_19_P3]
MPPIIFDAVQFRQGEFTLSASLTLPGGQLSVILGPSGSGKSTLLNLCAGFLKPHSGRIFSGSRELGPLPPEERSIGFVFQDHALFPHLSVLDNVAFGPRMRGTSRREARNMARNKLALVGLEKLAERHPASLSGGERQRVSLARALAPEPDILLLDEPLSSLDTSLRIRLRRELRAIIASAGVSALLVTHDQEEALAMADYLAVMNEGRIVGSGLPETLWTMPGELFTASFLGRKCRLEVLNFSRNSQGVLTALTPAGPIALPPACKEVRLPAVIAIRAEVLLQRPNGALRGRVSTVEFIGSGYLVELETDPPKAGNFLISCLPAPPPRRGDILSFEVNPADVILFEMPNFTGGNL